MPRITIGFGIALILLGVSTYFASGQSSLTALIPAAFGVVLAVLGVVGKRPAATKHAMHAAAAVGLIGLLGTTRGLGGFFTLITGGSVELPLAAIANGVMAIITASYLWLCIKSFREARKASQ